MKRTRRGFTLIELGTTTSCILLAMAAAYQLLYASRLYIRTGELDLQLVRDAAQIERAWRLDARRASRAACESQDDGTLALFQTPSGEVRWVRTGETLLRTDAHGQMHLASGVASARSARALVEPGPGTSTRSPAGSLCLLEVELVRLAGDVRRTQRVRALAAGPEVIR